MVKLPPEFKQMDRYPGYYINANDMTIYSCKTGQLKPLSVRHSWKQLGKHFVLSVKGYPRYIQVQDIPKMLQRIGKKSQEFPVYKSDDPLYD